MTSAINMLVAVAAFAGVVYGLLMFFRRWQRGDMETVVDSKLAPLKETAEVALNMAEKHEGVLFGDGRNPRDGLVAQVNYVQGRLDERERIALEKNI